MFMELREKRGLAYDLYAQYLPGLNSGELSFYIATDPAKTTEAKDGLEAIIARFREQSLDQEELEGARLQTLGKRKRAEETSTDQADAAMLNLLYGLGLDFEVNYQAQIAKLSAEDLSVAAKKYLVMGRAIVAVVGPAEVSPGRRR